MPYGKVDPYTLIIIGAGGDLALRKLLPSLYRLHAKGMMGISYAILGVDADEKDDGAYRAAVSETLKLSGPSDSDEAISGWCDKHLFYQPVASSTGDYEGLGNRISTIEQAHNLPGNRVFYLAVPSEAFGPVIERLGKSGLNRSRGWTRLVIEKPFGADLASARKLNAAIHRHFDESQIYRIDHFLGKEMVQNILAFRFANAIFEPVWNHKYIQSIEITTAEKLGLEDRVAYYEKAGALRDMVQGHLTQLLTLIAMESPTTFEAAVIRTEKLKVLRKISPLQPPRRHPGTICPRHHRWRGGTRL
ncbi:glucose-6-phosphate dehydrogenase [Chloroflexota bacterium]